jgi:hypothetical protein
MYNAKAFLEGLIVNEVLTKTASFEKLAQQPGVYPLGFNPNQNPNAIPPTLADAVRAAQNYYNWQAWQRRQRMEDAQAFREFREKSGLGDAFSQMNEAGRAAAARQLMKGKLPPLLQLMEKYPNQSSKVGPSGKIPDEGAPGPLPKAGPPGMTPPGLKPPAAPLHPSLPPYPIYPPSPSGPQNPSKGSEKIEV